MVTCASDIFVWFFFRVNAMNKLDTRAHEHKSAEDTIPQAKRDASALLSAQVDEYLRTGAAITQLSRGQSVFKTHNTPEETKMHHALMVGSKFAARAAH